MPFVAQKGNPWPLRSAADRSVGLGVDIHDSGCAGIAYGNSGGLDAFEANALVSRDGRRVAGLLLNGRTLDERGHTAAFPGREGALVAAA